MFPRYFSYENTDRNVCATIISNHLKCLCYNYFQSPELNEQAEAFALLPVGFSFYIALAQAL